MRVLADGLTRVCKRADPLLEACCGPLRPFCLQAGRFTTSGLPTRGRLEKPPETQGSGEHAGLARTVILWTIPEVLV